MGDMVLEAVVGDVVERVISLAVDEIGLLLCVKGEVKKLRTVLTSIQAVLQDAEEKQVKERTVKVWLQELKQVAYDAEDVLDEIAYKKLKYEIINKASRWFSPSRLIVHVKMAHKIKAINGRLDVIEKNRNRFQLVQSNYNQSGSSGLGPMNTTCDRESTSRVKDYSNVFGRESETKAIIKKLINDDGSSSSTDHQSIAGNNMALPVVAIVGLGGLGKTTLAQLVYNNDAVKTHFQLKVWICVSTNFETTNLYFQILQQILQQINGNNSIAETSSKEVVLNELESKLKQQGTKKFLLALDDDWNEDQRKWEDFVLPLRNIVATGSRIIVTSRDSNVASIRGAQTVHVHQIQGLSEDSCWDIIKSQAFKKDEHEKASLVEIGKQISNKCKGVPLAAKVLGGLLQSKKEDREWKAVRDAEFWNLPSDGTNQILEILKFSYYNLPSALKPCFSYCAIFPKDYWISKALLIELWMAHGLLGAGEVMEDVGNTYFNILYSKSFFQEAEINEYKEVIRCKMHDLVNDLAQSICKFECQNFGESNTMKAVDFSKCRHPPVISPVIVKDLCKAMKIRTIFGWGSTSIEFDNGGTVGATKISTFFKFKLLRVLDLSGFRCSDFSSSSLGKLKHLRYLDLSKTSIKSLPKWVTRLYQLQTLKLINCYELEELPEDLTNLKKLRHLFIDDYEKWKKLAEAVGELLQLRTLPLFVVCKEDAGRGISVLKNLNNLRGSLEIHRLCLMKEVSLAKGPKLSDKGKLRELSLH
ncbi:hypothetical protein Sjap_009408 [Stephania japonica]|uniref:Disease resistance protein RGA3 n=1 Tax=Stephania japonica TaxID=461633 RepID=A0AAP0JTM3_9MAGN